MISTPYALAFLALQMRHPDMRLSLTLRDDKPPVNANQAIAYIQLRYEREKPAEGWWAFAGRVLQEQAGGA
ncbi:MAG: hypothetical protein M0T84_01530 [Betaproteobacteria bacterium]|nr:hypothetical protein [Betaproteobacteria bacterium]